ncbi:MAG: acyltransferase family protein [Christensenellales bacterium]
MENVSVNISQANNSQANNSQSIQKFANISLIRGLSAISIVICHFIYYWTEFSQTYFPFYFAVQIFLFINGFLYSKKEIKNATKFCVKNCIKILVPTIIFVAIYFLVYGLFKIFGHTLALSELNPEGKTISVLGHLWFIYAICLCYLLVPILSKTPKVFSIKHSAQNNLSKNSVNKKCFFLILFFVVVCLIDLLLMAFAGSVSMFIPFLAGYGFKYVLDKQKHNSKIVLSIISFALFVLFSLGHYFLVNFFASIKFFALCETLLVALMAIFFTIFMIISFDFLNKKTYKIEKLLKISDKYSFYVYFTHPIFMTGGLSTLLITQNRFLAVVLTLVFTILLTIVLEFLSTKCYKAIINKTKL